MLSYIDKTILFISDVYNEYIVFFKFFPEPKRWQPRVPFHTCEPASSGIRVPNQSPTTSLHVYTESITVLGESIEISYTFTPVPQTCSKSNNLECKRHAAWVHLWTCTSWCRYDSSFTYTKMYLINSDIYNINDDNNDWRTVKMVRIKQV